MDDPNMTMEEYIKFEEEKARRHGRVFDWQTATYGKIRVDDDLYDLRSMEAEFPAIIVDDAFEPQDALQCKSQVSTPVNDEIDFRISFDESDDEDYTIICDKNSFSYKMISVNDLKTDSENDYEKVMPSIPSPEPVISCFDDLDFFEDFENEFPTIVYNDAQTRRFAKGHGGLLIYEGGLPGGGLPGGGLPGGGLPGDGLPGDGLPGGGIPGGGFKFGISSLLHQVITTIADRIRDMALPLREHRYRFLRYKGLEYTDLDIADFESRLERIYTREIHRVHVVDFQGMPELLRDGLFSSMAIEHCDEAVVVVFTSQAWGRLFGGARRLLSWRQFILALGLHTEEEMESPSFSRYLSESERLIPGKGDLHDYWSDILTDGDFLGPPPSYTLIRDSVLRLCHRMIAHNIAERIQAPKKVTVTDLFYLRGLDVGSYAPIIDEGGQAVPAPIQAPQQPPPPPPAPARTMPQWIARLEEDVHEIREALTEQREELPIHHILIPICPTRGASDRGLARPTP
ncbi:hypothetical protein Tco_0976592 [Tanacetum coccineum]|uniref:Uncharacterized protein n=1 Tax=Tanacetum coccineum TaxID=301880 RepID=A0ABQ5EHR0_9ASTR